MSFESTTRYLLEESQPNRGPEPCLVRGPPESAAHAVALWHFPGDGGVLLDADGGDLFRLGPEASEWWRHALGDPDRHEVAMASLTVPAAQRGHAQQGRAQSPIRVGADGACRFVVQEATIFQLTPDGQLALCVPPQRLERNVLESWLRAFAPRIARCAGGILLHAASVRQADGTIWAFTGTSGAGKTTTSAILASHGAARVSEDILFVAGDGADLGRAFDVELPIRAWADEAARTLGAGGLTTPPRLIAGGASAGPLARISCLSADRRRGRDFATRALSRSATCARLITAGFPPVAGIEPRLAYFAACGGIASAVGLRAEEATVPGTIAELSAALVGAAQAAAR